VWVTPDESVSDSELPNPSRNKLHVPLASLRLKVSSSPPLRRFASPSVEDCSCTMLAPSYRKLVVTPFTVLLVLLPAPSYWKLALMAGPLIETRRSRASQA